MRYANCRACGTQVQMATTAKRGLPFAVEIVADDGYGNVLIDGFGRAHVFADSDAARRFQEDHPTSDLAMSQCYVPHVARCAAVRTEREHRAPQPSLL